MNFRLVTIFILGFFSGLPLALLTSTLQAWYASAGMSLMATGMLSLIGLPYIYRFLWSPLLDRFSLSALGKRRSWILVMQGALCLGFNVLAWLSPQVAPTLMVCLAFFLACCAATQDVAIDAHRTEYLPVAEHGLGASIAVVGYRLAMLIAGGIALILAQYVGWDWTYRIMGGFFFIGMFATFFSQEPRHPPATPMSFAASFLEPVRELYVRPYIFALIAFIILYKLGEAFTTTTSGLMMPFLIQELGFDLATIGYLYKILGIGAILVGGIFAGWILLRASLFSALLYFGIFQALTNLLFVMLAMHGKQITLLAVAVICDNLAAGMGGTALVALLMRVVDRRFTATQFSLLIAISMLPRTFSGPISALLQKWFGWVGLFEWAVVLAFAFIPCLWLIRRQTIAPTNFEALES